MTEDKTFYRDFVRNMTDNGYSIKALLLLINSVNMGQLENPDIESKYVSDCGDMLILQMKLDGEIIVTSRFEYVGCMGLQVSASAVTEIIAGLSIEQAEKLGLSDVLAYLGSMPPAKYECMELALNTLWKGIKEYRATVTNKFNSQTREKS